MEAAYTMNVDDLFGDSEHVDLQSITATLHVKGLARRIDDLSASGCCQKVAWSKNGCVAYISPDGYTINLKVYFRDAESGKWDLGKDIPLDVPQGRDEFPFVHISWSHLGNDLAVVDAAGRVMLFTCAMALDRMHFNRAEPAHPDAEVDGVVGMHWLAIHPYELKNQIAWSTTREGNKWKWDLKTHIFSHPSHPVDSKASIVYLKRHGELKLRFQQNDSSWQEVTAQLGPMVSTKEPFTHAAFAPNNDGSLFLAAYDVAQRLHLYRVDTVWNVPQEKRNPNAGPFDKPGLQVTLVSIEDDCCPARQIDTDLTTGTETTGTVAAQLTHLNFLPITPEQDDGSLPTVQAIFCHPPDLISIDQLPSHSVLVRWQVYQTQQAHIHPSLDQVTSKKKSVGSINAKSTPKLKRLADFPLHSMVLSVYPLWYNMLLAFVYSDGTIEIRKRVTMETVMPDGDTNMMTSLLQAGFTFPHAEPSLHVALSPNHCIAVCMQLDGTIKLRSTEYQHGSLATDDDDPRHSAALAALVLQSASAANQYFSSDDIFSIIGTMSAKRKADFIKLLFDGLQVNIDIPMEEESNKQHLLVLVLSRAPFFVKTLSAMHLLGLNGANDRTLTSKVAWSILNIRFVTQIITTITRMHGQIDKSNLRPEVTPQLIGYCRWTMHFMAYLLDQLFALGRAVRSMPSASLTKSTLEQQMLLHNNPSLLLLLLAFPRAMMKLWSGPLSWVKRSADAYTAASAPIQSPDIRRLYTPLHTAVNELPFDHRWFDLLVSDTHAQVRTAYKRANASDAMRNHMEQELMQGRIPDLLFPIAKHLVTDSLWSGQACLAERLDGGALMFFDTTWLGLQESRRAKHWHAAHVVDVCQKMVIRGGGRQEHAGPMGSRGRGEGSQSVNGGAGKDGTKLRRCVRCAAYMEDVVQGLPGYTPYHVSWLMGAAKHCVCGNSWMMAEEPKMVR